MISRIYITDSNNTYESAAYINSKYRQYMLDIIVREWADRAPQLKLEAPFTITEFYE